MRLVKQSLLYLALLVLVLSCASTAKGRYYENLDMYTFVMREFRTQYNTSTVAEQQQMDREVLPLLDAWAKARQAWKLSMNDATKEQAAMLAYSEAKAALITLGIITVQQFEEVE